MNSEIEQDKNCPCHWQEQQAWMVADCHIPWTNPWSNRKSNYKQGHHTSCVYIIRKLELQKQLHPTVSLIKHCKTTIWFLCKIKLSTYSHFVTIFFPLGWAMPNSLTIFFSFLEKETQNVNLVYFHSGLKGRENIWTNTKIHITQIGN